MSNDSEVVVLTRGLFSAGARFRTFHPGFRFGQICHLVRHGQLTPKQLRLYGVNETHTKSLTGPRLAWKS